MTLAATEIRGDAGSRDIQPPDVQDDVQDTQRCTGHPINHPVLHCPWDTCMPACMPMVYARGTPISMPAYARGHPSAGRQPPRTPSRSLNSSRSSSRRTPMSSNDTYPRDILQLIQRIAGSSRWTDPKKRRLREHREPDTHQFQSRYLPTKLLFI